MHCPEEKLITILKAGGVDLLATLPCDRVRNLIALRVGDDLGHLTAGAGIRLPRLDIDVGAFSP